MSLLDSFNSWLSDQNLPHSTKNYTSATFAEGDFNASVDYFHYLVNNTYIKPFTMQATSYDKPTASGPPLNTAYSLTNLRKPRGAVLLC